MDKRYLTLDEAAARLRVTPQWLQRSSAPRVAGLGPRLIRYEEAELDTWATAKVAAFDSYEWGGQDEPEGVE